MPQFSDHDVAVSGLQCGNGVKETLGGMPAASKTMLGVGQLGGAGFRRARN